MLLITMIINLTVIHDRDQSGHADRALTKEDNVWDKVPWVPEELLLVISNKIWGIDPWALALAIYTALSCSNQCKMYVFALFCNVHISCDL
jgi:hypothetical protein